MKTSETVTEIQKAMSALQAEIKNAFKSTKGYGYNYSPIDEILKENRPLMSKHGLSHIQSQEFGSGIVSVTTRIMHNSGEWIETTAMSPFAQMKGMNDYQSIGSGITYLRRYGLSAALGIASDMDEDAHGEQQKQKATEDQVLDIESLLSETSSNKEEFLKFFSVGRVDELAQDQAKKAITMLNKKKGK